MAESEEELKSLLMRVKEESAKIGLKLNSKNKQRSWYLVPSLPGRDWETVEAVTDYFLGLQKSLQMVIAAMELKDTCFLEGKLWQT